MERETDSTGAVPKAKVPNIPIDLQEVNRSLDPAPEKPAKKVTFDDVPVVLGAGGRLKQPELRDRSKSGFIAPVHHKRSEGKAKQIGSRPNFQFWRQNGFSGGTKQISEDRNVQSTVVTKNGIVRKTKRMVPRGTEDVAVAAVKAVIPSPPSPSENVFARPELNSALHIAEQILEAEAQGFDEAEAVRKKLETSELTRKTLDKKSTMPVNVPPSEVVFQNVIPLEFDEEALVTAAAEELEAKFRTVQPIPRKRDPEPDISEFFSDDFQPEFVSIPTPNIAFPHLTQTVLAPGSMVYNLYKHKRMWEDLPL